MNRTEKIFHLSNNNVVSVEETLAFLDGFEKKEVNLSEDLLMSLMAVLSNKTRSSIGFLLNVVTAIYKKSGSQNEAEFENYLLKIQKESNAYTNSEEKVAFISKFFGRYFTTHSLILIESLKEVFEVKSELQTT